MARTNARYRAAFNSLLDLCDSLALQDKLPSELALAEEIGVSRTVVRTALRRLHDEQIIYWQGRAKTLIRKPAPEDRLSLSKETIPMEQLEERFLDWLLRFDVPPGTSLNVAQLSKRFEVAPHTLQEFLSSLSRLGLVERRARGGWMLLGFTTDYALELSEFRAVLELNAIRHLVELPPTHPVWSKLSELRAQHLSLLERIETHYHDFSRLDERFHSAINSVVKNRFVSESQKVISLIFHYHYQWDKSEERTRNEAAIGEHLACIDALESGDPTKAVEAAQRHLNTSKQTLLSSLKVHNLG